MAKVSKSKEKPKKTVEDKLGLEERATKLVLSNKAESLQFYESKFKQFNYFDRLYLKGAAKSNVPYGRANLQLPLAFQQIEPFVSQMTETMVGEAPYIAYEGRTQDDDVVAEEITNFSQYQLDVGGFLPSFIQYLRAYGKYGTAVMKVRWFTDVMEYEDVQEKEQQVLNPDTGEIETKITEIKIPQQITKHDGPLFESISLFDFFVPRSATSANVQLMPWVIHRVYRSPEQLLTNTNYNLNRDKLKALVDDYDDCDSSKTNIKDESKLISQEQKNVKGATKFSDKLEILERWGEFNFTKDGPLEEALIVVVSAGKDQFPIRIDRNPLKFKFKPFIMANDYPVEGEPYGYGELHHIQGLIEESTALRNARLDVANISLNRVWLVERQSGVNIRELYTAPNKVILTNDLNGIRPMDMGNITTSSVQELARIDFDIQNTTEIINPRQDVSNVGAAFGSTATGVSFLASKSNLRLMTKARILEATFFKPLADMLNWYNRDFITTEQYYRVQGKEDSNPYRTLPPDAFLTEVDFKPTSNPQKLSVAERRDNMSYLLQVVAQVEKVAPGTNNLPKLLRDVYKLAGFPHSDEYVNEQGTTIFQTPDGQVVDKSGKPVQVLPVDASGNVVQNNPTSPGGSPNA